MRKEKSEEQFDEEEKEVLIKKKEESKDLDDSNRQKKSRWTPWQWGIFLFLSLITLLIGFEFISLLEFSPVEYVFCPRWVFNGQNQDLEVSGNFNDEQKKEINEIKEKKVTIYYGWPACSREESSRPYGYFFFILSNPRIKKKFVIFTQVKSDAVFSYQLFTPNVDLTLDHIEIKNNAVNTIKDADIKNIIFKSKIEKVSFNKTQIAAIEKEMNKEGSLITTSYPNNLLVKNTLVFLNLLLSGLFFFSSQILKISYDLMPKIIVSLIVYWIIKKYVSSSTTSFFKNLKELLKASSAIYSSEEEELSVSPQKKIFFKDIGGLLTAKTELLEIMDLYKNHETIKKYNIEIPKGVLLEGSPGNGKTLLARAFANECGLPFIFRSGSEFEEIYFGLGALRVRNLFKKALDYSKKYGGCVIFIDEFDSLAGRRSQQNKAENNTLNQLLNELDGFTTLNKILVIASTNLKEMLDPAVVRAGRFDRHIRISKPNLIERKEIIILQKKKLKNINFDFETEDLVSITEGTSSAQITTTFNEAVILYIKRKQNKIDINLLVEAFEKTIFGVTGAKASLNEKDEKITAYHESGHALIALSLIETYVNWVTISPKNGEGMLGYTSILLSRGENIDLKNLTKKEILSLIIIQLGGRVAEEIIFGKDNITTGACHDLTKVSDNVNSLILEFGMTNLGVIPYEISKTGKTVISGNLSEQTKEEIESVRRQILDKCWRKARRIVEEQRNVLEAIARSLLIKKKLSRQEINRIFITGLPLGIEELN